MIKKIFLVLLIVTANHFAEGQPKKNDERVPADTGDIIDSEIGAFTYSVTHDKAKVGNTLTVKQNGSVLCTFQSNTRVAEGFTKVSTLTLGDDSNRFFVVFSSNVSDAPEELRILDLKPSVESNKGTSQVCTFGTIDRRDQLFSGLNVEFENNKNILTVKELVSDFREKLKYILTTCKLSPEKELTCDQGKITPYHPSNP